MIKLYTTYPDAWEAMLGDCRSAQKYIYFEQFILEDFEEGQIGRQFVDMFVQKAKEGVSVRLIVDAAGGFNFFTDLSVQEELEDAGVELKFFDIVPRWKAVFPFSQFHRDHRKVIVIDDAVAHVGGVVLTETARDWHDVHSCIQDPAYVKEIKGAYLRMWDEIKDTKEHESEYDTGNGLILKTDPEHNDLHEEILKRVRAAKEKIVIITPYLSPDKAMFDALMDACKRGVDVTLVIPEEGDSIVSTLVTGSYFKELSTCDINTHFYCKCLNHGKLVVIDGWVTLGSMNFDRLSFFYNRELNIITDRSKLDWDNFFEKVTSNCGRMEESYMKKRGLVKRGLDMVGFLLRPIA